jgi:geranylgeranyl diphosphate synthase, type I
MYSSGHRLAALPHSRASLLRRGTPTGQCSGASAASATRPSRWSRLLDRRSGSDSQHRVSASAGRKRQVAAALGRAIDLNVPEPESAELLRQLLARRGFALARQGRDRWAPYVFDTAVALGASDTAAIARATAGVECAVAAIDVMDDLVDDEWDDPHISRSRATNASLALGFLAQCCVVGLDVSIQTLLASSAIGSAAGQDLDLLLESRDDVTPQRALQVTVRKSGSLGAMACQVGAALCTDDPLILQLLGIFGRNLGTCAQLLNDLAGVDIDQVAREKSDLRRRKKTVPVAYTLECARREGLDWLLEWYREPPRSSPDVEAHVAAVMHDLGALQYTWVLADSYHREARTALEALVEQTGRRELGRLSRLLPSVRARPRS